MRSLSAYFGLVLLLSCGCSDSATPQSRAVDKSLPHSRRTRLANTFCR